MPNDLPNVHSNKHRTKAQLIRYVEDHLQPGLDTHRILKYRIQTRVDNWMQQACGIEDNPPAKMAEPDRANFVDSAFHSQHAVLAEKYFEALDYYSKRQEGSKAQFTAFKKVKKAGEALNHSRNTYDMKIKRYEDAYEKYQLEQENPSEYEKRISPYRQEITRLRSELANMVKTYNEERGFDEAYTGNDYKYVFKLQYVKYVPTQHGWFPEVQGGTYIYDYKHNELQLHLHFNTARNKVEAVRIKRYGDKHGEKADKNWGLVEHVSKQYPYVWQKGWTQVTLD